MDQDKMSSLYRGSSIDASYQVSVHMAEGFQRRRLKCEKWTDDGRQKLTLPMARWANKIGVDKWDVSVSAATFRQHMRMACLFPNLFDTPELADSTVIS